MAKSRKTSVQNTSDLSKTKWNIFYFISILIPVLFFILLEISLRFFNYGLAHEQWVESADGQGLEKGGKYLMLNPEIARKYFHDKKDIPFSNEDAFYKVKGPNSFRVFILGESSAAGFPFEPNGSFSKYLSDRLSLVYPNSKIEVINCSISAINSYTLRDLTPGILKQKPDLILFYTGHNEYYGALGAGSTESLGNSRFLINLSIYLEKYRSFQLLKNTINIVSKIFYSKDVTTSGTLMTQMAQNQYIIYGSDIYKNGLSQFDENMADMLDMITAAHVPVIIGTLTCNLKGQFPFVSISSLEYPPADNIFKEASRALEQKKLTEADSLFRYAKDLDALKFRAPSDINTIIYKLARKYGIQVLDIDSVFQKESPDHIVGNNLIVDHLHPALHGYQLMGKLFYEKMKECNYLPNSKPRNFSDRNQDSLTVANFHFTSLDSVIADYKITVLKNNWPFASNTSNFTYSAYIHPKNRIDSIAADWIKQNISWKNAHLLAVEWYLQERDINHFLREMDVLIGQYPYNTKYYDFTAVTLSNMKEYKHIYMYLFKSYTIEPNVFNTKWLGSFHLNKGEMDSARYFLNQSLIYDSRDPQTWYNLAVTYLINDKSKALSLINSALAVNPNFYDALILRNQLTNQK